MGHHVDSDGNFHSDKYLNDKYPDLNLPPNKILLSFGDPIARKALRLYAELSEDTELAEDIIQVIEKMEK